MMMGPEPITITLSSPLYIDIFILLFNHIQKFVKQIVRIAWTGRSFRMKLHAEYGEGKMLHSLHCFVIHVQVCYLQHISVEAFFHHLITMILRCYENPVFSKIFYRMI